MSTRRLLKVEEVTMLQKHHIPKIYGEYHDIVEAVNALVKRMAHIEGDDIYLSDADQVRLLKKIGKQVIELENAAKDMKLYLRDIAIRLDLL